jgi:hypothetical protein
MEKYNQLKYHLLLASAIGIIILLQNKPLTPIFISTVLIVLLGIFVLIHILIDVFILTQKPQYYSYNEDIFYNIKWKWDWNKHKKILNLNAFCPACNQALYFHYDSLLHKTEFICHSCNKQLANVNSSHRNFVQQSVKSSITRKLKKENPSF